MKNKKNKNKKKNNKNKKKRAPDPPGYLRPNSFVPRAPKGTHAVEGSLASEKVSLPMLEFTATASEYPLKLYADWKVMGEIQRLIMDGRVPT